MTTATNSSPISRRFAELRAKGEMGLVAYITAGDPTLAATEQICPGTGESPAQM